ncbi:hypothetical protein [Rhodococcus sp. RD6.2]|uniref:hypothetical protein n=1 Tax=Rhodococcus sp. RD6.2 TaxID=260936 RepID=UPI0012EE5E68|nr:hypothetical protein [Rhodococcus sp. RD6.2]
MTVATASAALLGAGGVSAQPNASTGCGTANGKAFCTYDSSAGIVEFFLDVPLDVTTMHVVAEGGSGAGPQGGRGALVEGDVAVTPGSKVYVVIGSGGGAGTNRGGGYSSLSTVSLDDGVAALAGRLIVAGGGGGSGLGPGGDAGVSAPAGGQAGTINAGGAAGVGGTAGTLGSGGSGGIGGGGGGGLYGGGGGTGGGGGGSSLVPAGGTFSLSAPSYRAKLTVYFDSNSVVSGSSDPGDAGSSGSGSAGSSDSGSAGSSGSGSAGSSDMFGSSQS